MSDKETALDKVLDIRRIARYLRGNKRFRDEQMMSLFNVETQFQHLEQSREMVRAHLEFLDHLTEESRRAFEAPPVDYREFTDYRVEFVTWFLQHRPEKKRIGS